MGGRSARARKKSSRQQRHGSQKSTASSAAAPISLDLSPPTETDYRRYRAYRAGLPIADICAAERVHERTILTSIQRVKLDNARYAADETGVAVRRMLHAKLPEMGDAISAALAATKLVGKKVVMIDKQTGERVEMEEDYRYLPDHDARLRAIDSSAKFLSIVQPKDPAIQITNTQTTNSQTNIVGGHEHTQGALTSPEAVIRAVVAERQQRALGTGTSETITAAPPLIEGEVIESASSEKYNDEEDDTEYDDEYIEDDGADVDADDYDEGSSELAEPLYD